MSYVLHIWEHPASRHWPASVAEADQFISVASGMKLGKNRKFSDFARALTQSYPDFTMLEETEEGLPDCVWTDSPVDGQTEDAVYVIGVSSEFLDKDLIHFIAHAACDQGLHMFDMQEGMLYRPDRTTIDAKGDARVISLYTLRRLPASYTGLEFYVKRSMSELSIEGAAKELIFTYAPAYHPREFMPFVPKTVQLEMKAQTRDLPKSVDDFEVWYFPKYSRDQVAGLTEEEIDQKKREDVRKHKQRLLDGMRAVRLYLEDIGD